MNYPAAAVTVVYMPHGLTDSVSLQDILATAEQFLHWGGGLLE